MLVLNVESALASALGIAEAVASHVTSHRALNQYRSKPVLVNVSRVPN